MVSDEIELQLERQKVVAMRIIRRTRQHVVSKAPRNAYIVCMKAAKLRKLDWMERYVTKYRWMPGSFRKMCHAWTAGCPRNANLGLGGEFPWGI